MNLNLLFCVACSAALLLGACSSGNPPAPDGNGDSNGNDQSGNDQSGNDQSGNDQSGDSAQTQPDPARTAYQNAQTAVMRAITEAQRAATPAARDEARVLIKAARTALDDAVKSAEAALAAAVAGSPEHRAADGFLNRVNDYKTRQEMALNDLLIWYRRDLVRHPLARREVMDPRPSANTAKIDRTPRTKDDGNGNQVANDDAIKSDTFNPVRYSANDMVFSNSGDEFEVDGYVTKLTSIDLIDETIHTGLKLTNDGLVIRTGGTVSASETNQDVRRDTGDFTDMRKDITTWESDSNDDSSVTAADDTPGQNGWDLTITFNKPQTKSVPVAFKNISDPVSSWRGNNAFYWSSLVRPRASQIPVTRGSLGELKAFYQPAGQENLGTYEVWLSNNVGVNRMTEPNPPGTEVVCENGRRGTFCPDDDVHRYLNYAAYGLFVYTADTETFKSPYNDFNGQLGRINTIHFGYLAFANENGRRTTDIGESITSGIFTGYTLAYEVKGAGDQLPIQTKLLRGDVSLTVKIPKGTGTGTLEGTMDNFQRWNDAENYWDAYTDGFEVILNDGESDPGPVDIMSNGAFSGVVTATPTTGLDERGKGVFKGNFYGPLADKDDLEIAGSWTVGSEEDDYDGNMIDLYGSFGAKQDFTNR